MGDENNNAKQVRSNRCGQTGAVKQVWSNRCGQTGVVYSNNRGSTVVDWERVSMHIGEVKPHNHDGTTVLNRGIQVMTDLRRQLACCEEKNYCWPL